MTEHDLKTVNPYFTDVWNEEKLFEIRKNDRNYKKGDLLKLREYVSGEYTGRAIYAEIEYFLPENTFEGLSPGYCALGIFIVDMFTNGDCDRD